MTPGRELPAGKMTYGVQDHEARSLYDGPKEEEAKGTARYKMVPSKPRSWTRKKPVIKT